MTEPYLAAAIQMESSTDKEANLAAATRLVEEAASLGARLIALPELFNCLGRLEIAVAQAESIPGPTSEALSRLAARLGVTLAAGSIAERDGSSAKAFNTSLLFGPDGALLARYRKLRLFDAELPGGVTARESQWISRGSETIRRLLRNSTQVRLPAVPSMKRLLRRRERVHERNKRSLYCVPHKNIPLC